MQPKEQAELDSVVETGRLTTFADREHLVYVNALQRDLATELCRAVWPYTATRAVSQTRSERADGGLWDWETVRTGSRGNSIQTQHPITLTCEQKLPWPLHGRSLYIYGSRLDAQSIQHLHARDGNGNEIPVEPLYTSGLIMCD